MRTRSLALATLTLLPTLLAAAWAQPASMLLDLGKEVFFASPLGQFDRTGREPVELDGVLYFLSNDEVHGFELWRTDGTAAGSMILQDTCPGICGSFPDFLTAFRHKMYWSAFDGLHSLLLVSDGTPQGTGPAFGSGSPVASHSLFPLGEAGGRLLLSGLSGDGSNGELWATDGTAAGFVRLRSFRVPESPSAARPSLIGRAGGFLVFSIGSETQHESLWATDGTVAGTVQLNAGAPGVAFTGRVFNPFVVAVGSRLFFEALGPTGDEAWVSDGTAAGTHPLAGVFADGRIAAVGSQLFFFRTTAGGSALWKSDSTLAGATLVKDLSGLPDESSFGGLIAAGSRLFFWGSRNLWVSDGTEAGTHPVREVPGLLGLFQFAMGDRLGFFVSDAPQGYHPWVSDGTAASTHEVAADVRLSSDWFSGVGSLGGRWLFDSRDSEGWFLWASDGSPGNLTRVTALDLQTSPFLSPLTDLNGTMLFFGSDFTTGVNLWRTDGSAGGTFPVENLVPPGSDTDFIPFAPQLAVIGSRLFFDLNFSIWETDGTAAGTRQVPATSAFRLTGLDQAAAKVGNSLYFIASESPSSLVKTDGTDAGTVVLHSFGSNETLSRPTAVGDRLFFAVTDFGPLRTALWTSDGTAAGTKPIAAAHTFRNPTFWSALGLRLLFTDADAAGVELWASDGTPAGTRRLKRIAAVKPGQGLSVNPGLPDGFLAVAAGRVFFAGDDGAHGSELWVSDGTAAGARMLVNIARGASGSAIGSFAAVGNRVFFAADDGVHGRELWVTNGTAAGTRMVADIVPGARSSYLGNLTAVDGLLLFAADDGVHGLEPWVSDGTRAGTRMLQDVAPGPLPSSPSGFFLSGHEVYFTANDATHGFELWAMPLEALTEHP
ncbi:MAG TPA: ELWxxDGT repeat protein [Thermoanaerobaculia bacterium]|nr:ELWxxDGT repeat protein [Thermoanaerobaculia bacterium]